MPSGRTSSTSTSTSTTLVSSKNSRLSKDDIASEAMRYQQSALEGMMKASDRLVPNDSTGPVRRVVGNEVTMKVKHHKDYTETTVRTTRVDIILPPKAAAPTLGPPPSRAPAETPRSYGVTTRSTSTTSTRVSSVRPQTSHTAYNSSRGSSDLHPKSSSEIKFSVEDVEEQRALLKSFSQTTSSRQASSTSSLSSAAQGTTRSVADIFSGPNGERLRAIHPAELAQYVEHRLGGDRILSRERSQEWSEASGSPSPILTPPTPITPAESTDSDHMIAQAIYENDLDMERDSLQDKARLEYHAQRARDEAAEQVLKRSALSRFDQSAGAPYPHESPCACMPSPGPMATDATGATGATGATRGTSTIERSARPPAIRIPTPYPPAHDIGFASHVGHSLNGGRTQGIIPTRVPVHPHAQAQADYFHGGVPQHGARRPISVYSDRPYPPPARAAF